MKGPSLLSCPFALSHTLPLLHSAATTAAAAAANAATTAATTNVMSSSAATSNTCESYLSQTSSVLRLFVDLNAHSF
eukprot:5047149-Pyramimonas_sp.AAC.2